MFKKISLTFAFVAFSTLGAMANVNLAQTSTTPPAYVPIAPASCPDGSDNYEKGRASMEESGAKVILEKNFPDGTFGVLFDVTEFKGYDPSTPPYMGFLFDGETHCWLGVVMPFTEQEAQDLWGLKQASN